MHKSIILSSLLLLSLGIAPAFAFSGETDGKSSDVRVCKMGVECGRDSSKASGRSLPYRLVMPKGSFGAGLQFFWAGMDASEFQALALVSGVGGGISFGNVAPAFCWAWADNHALGLRLSYTGADINLASGTVRLFSDDLKFELGGLNTKVNSYGASIFNRSWIGLDKDGRFSLFADIDLGYSYTTMGNDKSRAITNSIALSFAPGVEIFVLNSLSLYLSLSFAHLSYGSSKCQSATTDATTQEVSWNDTGACDGFDACVRLNLLDLHFGLAYYF